MDFQICEIKNGFLKIKTNINFEAKNFDDLLKLNFKYTKIIRLKQIENIEFYITDYQKLNFSFEVLYCFLNNTKAPLYLSIKSEEFNSIISEIENQIGFKNQEIKINEDIIVFNKNIFYIKNSDEKFNYYILKNIKEIIIEKDENDYLLSFDGVAVYSVDNENSFKQLKDNLHNVLIELKNEYKLNTNFDLIL